MSRRLFPLLVAFAGLVFGLWWLIRTADDGDRLPVAQGPTRTAEVAPAGEGELAPASPGDAAAESRRAALDADLGSGPLAEGAGAIDAAPDVAEGPDFEMFCVRAVGGGPVAGARIYALDMDPETLALCEAELQAGADAEQIGRRYGVLRRADERGRVRVPEPRKDRMVVFGFADGLMAVGHPASDPARPDVLSFLPAEALAVRLVDMDGRGVAGVSLETVAENAGAHLNMARSAVTDANGRARVEMVNHAAAVGTGEQEAVLIRPRGLLADPPVLRHVPGWRGAGEGEVELSLGPHGWVELVLPEAADGPGAPWLPLVLRADGQIAGQMNGLLAGRTLRLGPVELGLQLEARATGLGAALPWVAAGAGPTAQGEVARLVLTRPDSLRVRGRILGPDGRPLERIDLGAHLVGPWRTPGILRQLSYERLAVDADGRFTWWLPTDVAAGSGALLKVTAAGRDQYFLRGLSSAGLGAGPNAGRELDLGELLLEEPGILVSGRLVDIDNHPVEGARLEVITSVTQGGIPIERPLESSPVLRSDREGRFTFHLASGDSRLEPPAGSALQLAVSARGLLDARFPISVGDEHLLLELAPEVVLTGRLALDPHVPTGDLLVVAQPLQPGPGVHAMAPPMEDGTFRLARIGSGPHRLWLQGRAWASGPLLLMDSLELHPHDSGERDLGQFDLSGRLHVTHLWLTGPGGRPIEHARLEFEVPGRPVPGTQVPFDAPRDRLFSQAETEPGLHVLVHTSRPIRTDVFADGARGGKVVLDGDELHLELGAPVSVSLVLVGIDGLPAVGGLRANVSHLERGIGRGWEPVDGRIELELEDEGPWLLDLNFHGGEGGRGLSIARQLERLAPENSTEPQTIHVQLSADFLESARRGKGLGGR